MFVETKSFICQNCGKLVEYSKQMRTDHRNHCNFCLWSLHVDQKTGDRKASCQSKMQPIGLTFKNKGQDKYGNNKRGELMLVHCCLVCDKISINRIAADDDNEVILQVFNDSLKIKSNNRKKLRNQGINIIGQEFFEEVKTQLFGKG